MKKYLALLLLPLYCLADEYSIKGGPAILNGSPTGSSKYFAIRQENHEFAGVYSALELGGWVDNLGEGHKSSAIGKAQLGVNPGGQTGLYGKAFFGPALISSPDVVLGSVPQFSTDVGIGVRDMNSSMFFGYGHISNAGIFPGPNKGRDFILMGAGVKF